MNKKLIIAGVAAATIIMGTGIGAVAALNESCGYDQDGNFHSGGKVYAHGSMQDAEACAAKGLLPAVVYNRLGIWGDAATRKHADEVRAMNDRVIAEKKAAEKAAKEGSVK